MDILGFSRDCIKKMNMKYFNKALIYASITYNLRRVDLPWRKKTEEPAVRWKHDFVSKVGRRKK